MITIVTGNPNKLKELQAMFPGREMTSAAVEIPEIQSLNLEEIVCAKVRDAFNAVGGPVIIEDVSFEIAALKGMPGPFVKWWAKTAGYEPALIVCEAVGDWSAKATCGAAYFDGERLEYVEGIVTGRLSARAGEEGFGFDFYFVPDGYDRTFAQLGLEIKNKISHRALAMAALRDRIDRV